MPSDRRPARPKQRGALPAAPGLGALLLLAGLAACGGAEPVAAPAPSAPPAVIEPVAPPPAVKKPPSSFSLVVDEAIRRKKVIERLKAILRESEP